MKVNKNKKIKGQVSVEILSIVGFVLFLFIPLILVSLSKANEIEWNSVMEKETYVLRELTTSAESVFTSSDGTSIKKTIFFPDSVVSLRSETLESGSDFYGSYLILEDKYGNQITDYTPARIEVDANLNPGTNSLAGYQKIIIEKKNDGGVEKVIIKKA